MRAVRYHAYGGPLHVEDVPDPECPRDGVIVRVLATGVCRSDWHCWLGHDPVPLPMIPGHELAGVIEAVGDGVERWHVGDRVTVPFACGCGECAQCADGDTHVCPRQTQPGCTDLGSFAELVALRNADLNLVALPDGVDPAAAAALGCRTATAYRALVTQGRLQQGEWLAVHGCGGVGLSAAMIAREVGARVIAIDPSPEARAAAQALGAEVALAPSGDPERDAQAVRSATGGGAHVSMDALGSESALRACILGLRPRGRHLQVGLLLEGDVALPLGPVIARELRLYGCHGMPASDYPGLLAMVSEGSLRLEALVERVVGLEDAPQALRELGEPAARRGITVVDPTR